MSDSRYFVGTVALLNSLRLMGQTEPMVVLDRGLQPRQRALLEQAATVLSPSRRRHGYLSKLDAPRRLPAAEVVAILDADVIITRSLGQLLQRAAQGSVVAFADDQPDRFHPQWRQALGVDRLHRHPYVNTGFLLLPGDLWPAILEQVGGLQDRTDFSRSRGFGEGSMADPFRLSEQDCWNAVLAALVAPARMTVLDHALAPFQPWEPAEVEDERTLRCRLADGRRPYLLHHIGRKPWLVQVPPSAFSALLPRVLHGDDVAVRLEPPPPLVSVVLPTYQRREAVRRAVASVLAQTFGDFELIVVDDGSSDGTDAALASLGEPLRYVWQPNRGPSAARNRGLALARGELVAFLDSDDRWLPEHLAVIVALMRAHPQAVLASTSPGYRAGGRAPLKRASAVEPFPAILTKAIAGFVSSAAVRRTELEAVGGFDESLPTCEDTDLWLRLALRGQFVLLARRTAVIERTEGSLSSQARHNGTQRSAYQRSLTRVSQQLAQAGEERSASAVRGALWFAEALAMLDAGEPSIADKLSLACSALPTLSQDWGSGIHMLTRLPSARTPAARLRHLSTLTAAWPDSGCPMAVALHVYGALAAVRARRPRSAIALLAGTPPGELLRLVAAGSLRVGARRTLALVDWLSGRIRRAPVTTQGGWRERRLR